MRTIVSYFIGVKNPLMVKKCLRQILVYTLLLMSLVTLALFAVKDLLLRLFFIGEHVRLASRSSMTMLCLNVIPHSSFPILSGALRFVGSSNL